MASTDEDKNMRKMIALEYVGIGVTTSIIVVTAFYLGMKLGFEYGLGACGP